MLKNVFTKIKDFFKNILTKITGQKKVYNFKDKPSIKEETPHVTKINVWGNNTPEILNETKPLVTESTVELKEKFVPILDEVKVSAEEKSDLTNLTIEELRKMAGDHNILVKPADSKEYIIKLIEKHVKDHHK